MSNSVQSTLTVIGTDTGTEHLDHAIAISKRLGASLTIIVMDMTRPSAVSNYGAATAILRGDAYEHGQKAIDEHASIAQAQLDAAGLQGEVVSANVLPSEVDDVTIDYARLADLTLLPLKLPVTSTMFRHILHGAVFRAGSPTLLLPATGSEYPESSNAMIAWDPGIPCGRAVRQAIGVLGQAGTVTGVAIGNEPGNDTLDERLVRYMNSHHIEIGFQNHWRQNETTGGALLRVAQSLSADLIVMGAFGHSRLRDFVVGSTTRDVIEHSTIPVLVMH